MPVNSVPSTWVGGMLWAQTGTQSQLPNTVRVPVSEAGSPFPEPPWFSPGQHTEGCREKMGKQGSGQAEILTVGRRGTGGLRSGRMEGWFLCPGAKQSLNHGAPPCSSDPANAGPPEHEQDVPSWNC